MLNKHLATPKASRRHVRRSFDTLRANDEKPNNKSQTLFFGIPKGTFYKKSPLAGHGAAPHVYGPDSCLQPKAVFCGLISLSAVQHLATPKASRRHVRRSFDTLRANDEKPNNKSQTLFFGIPKGTFYKKSPLAGHGAAPHEYSLIAACNRRPCFAG